MQNKPTNLLTPKLLVRHEVEQRLSAMWDRITLMTDDDHARDASVQEALTLQGQLYKQLHAQEQILPLLWHAAHNMDYQHPIAGAIQLADIAERIRNKAELQHAVAIC
jgi:hypothetical protein